MIYIFIYTEHIIGKVGQERHVLYAMVSTGRCVHARRLIVIDMGSLSIQL